MLNFATFKVFSDLVSIYFPGFFCDLSLYEISVSAYYLLPLKPGGLSLSCLSLKVLSPCTGLYTFFCLWNSDLCFKTRSLSNINCEAFLALGKMFVCLFICLTCCDKGRICSNGTANKKQLEYLIQILGSTNYMTLNTYLIVCNK